MSIFQKDDSISILRLQLKHSCVDAFAAQSQIGNLLNQASISPNGISPNAWLCIRKLHDPLPGTIKIQFKQRPLFRKWQHAFRNSIDHFAVQAVRPIHGTVPANAEAVIFKDRSELLACLARDWCEGSVITRWWWQGLFKGKDISQAIFTAWLEGPEFIPGALERLAEIGKVVPFIRMLSRQQAADMIQRIIHCFGLTALKEVYESVLVSETLKRSIFQESETNSELSQPPWLPWVPEAREDLLTREQQIFIGIGLMLLRAPMVVRSAKFAQSVQEWGQATPVPKKKPLSINPPLTDVRESGIFEEKVTDIHPLPKPDYDAGDKKLSSLNVSNVSDNHAYPISSGTDAALSVNNQQPAKNKVKTPILPELAVKTEYGGIFYLINLGLFLELYRDFTLPLEPGIDLPIWDFVALVGQALAGEKITADPVWHLLAQLAGRTEGESPGQSFAPPDHWRLPAEWLKSFPESGVCLWSAAQGRLRVLHPEKFWLVDLPLKKKAPEKLHQQMLTFQGIANLTWEPGIISENVKATPSLDRWLGWLLPYVRARLKRALGVTEDSDLTKILCSHHALVQVTATHLDVRFSLAELPIAIRLSGLDRNPGWVPATGRYINFHFE